MFQEPFFYQFPFQEKFGSLGRSQSAIDFKFKVGGMGCLIAGLRKFMARVQEYELQGERRLDLSFMNVTVVSG